MIQIAHNKRRENYLKKKFCEKCAEYGYTELCLWASKNGSKLTAKTVASAAKGGYLETIKV